MPLLEELHVLQHEALSEMVVPLCMQATGIAFPQVTKFWQGETYRCVGAGVRTKKVAFVGVKVRICSVKGEAHLLVCYKSHHLS